MRAPLLPVLLGLGLCAPAGASAVQPVAAPFQPEHRGGSLRLTADANGGTLDPQINYVSTNAQIFAVTNDGLTAFAKVDGPGSATIVADLADSLPIPTDGGRTYVFHLHPGIRFSTGQTLKPSDVLATMRRIFKVGSPTAGSFYGGIVGATQCLKDAAHCTLAGGVEADDTGGTVTFHLTQPDGEFFDKLAMPHASVVPADTPIRDLGNIPAAATGPYRITAFDPNHGMTLERNPYFHVWDPVAQPEGYADRIQYDFGLTDEAQVTAVENGQYDWMFNNKPLDRLSELGDRYASQVHIQDMFAIFYVPMNMNLPPFNNLEARQAVNYAVNRAAMAIFFGGPAVAEPLCEMVPTGIPGRIDACFYSKGADFDHPAQHWQKPDLVRARALVKASGTKGAKLTLIVPNRAVDISMGIYLQNTLRQIGYDTSVKFVTDAIEFNYIQNTNNKVQISLTDWFADYPAASNFLDDLFGCENFHPGSDSSINISGMCDRTIQAAMQQAGRISVTDPKAGAALWSQVGRQIMQTSAAAPLIQFKYIDLVSKRLGHYTYTLLYHMLFSQVWVQ
ncbi:ABC transporter substrate-binding protein [Lichenicoccus sp.]|uniref:ABC transporter substrate-binding protein n=1 Tax=Lichenicoccus sp. TaxID=2781899 RepID=UPI003D0EB5C1